MEIHVIRHTPVTVNQGLCYGQLDVPVAETFPEDVKKIAEKLPTDFDAIFCSPLTRCKQLANALPFQNIQFDKRLLEFDYGDWEGQKWDEITKEELSIWMDDFIVQKTKNGESLEDMFLRIQDFLDQLRNKEYKKVLLITHAGVIRNIWSYLLEIPLKNIFKVPVGFHELFVFKLGHSKEYDILVKKH